MAANAVRWYGCVLIMEESNAFRMVLKLKWWIKKKRTFKAHMEDTSKKEHQGSQLNKRCLNRTKWRKGAWTL